MKKKILIVMLLLVLVISYGCSKPADKAEEGKGDKKPAGKVEQKDDKDSPFAKKQEVNGLYSGELTTLNYLTTASTNEFSVLANFIDTLIDYDKYGVPKPALALEWSHKDSKVWTFKLRKGVKWYDSNGKEKGEVKAQDFVESAKYILTKKNASSTASLLNGLLVNAKAYYDGKEKDFSKVGVKAIDDYTLEYTLERPTPYFLSMTTYVCFFPVNGEFLKEKGDKFGTDKDNLLYNGAYILKSFQPENERVYVKNENYWDKDNVFIKKVSYKYNKEASTLGPEMFARGEISSAKIPSNILDSWLKDPKKKDMIRPSMNGFYTYWYAFNFDPKFDAKYEPENWKKAVNNLNFRKAIFHAFDRKAAMLTDEPYNPEQRLTNTITPKNFIDLKGVDYVNLEPLKAITARDSFNKEKAVEYMKKAKEELKGKVTFPVKVLMPYNPSLTNWTNRVQVVKQQIEKVLGKDFVDFKIEAGPTTGFLSAVRRSGKYAFMEVNWGPDYADPYTYTEPFQKDNSYAKNNLLAGAEKDGKLIYDEMVKKANELGSDLAKRYNSFAEAEKHLIENAIVIPYGVSNSGFYGSHLNPFEAGYSAFGVAEYRYKGQKVYKKPMSSQMFKEQLEKWTKEREEALKK